MSKLKKQKAKPRVFFGVSFPVDQNFLDQKPMFISIYIFSFFSLSWGFGTVVLEVKKTTSVVIIVLEVVVFIFRAGKERVVGIGYVANGKDEIINEFPFQGKRAVN